MKLDKFLFDSVSHEAELSPRLRMALDMRTSPNDGSQRMLNALEPGTVLPIHRHTRSSETCIILRGSAIEIFYDDHGNETERVLMAPATECCGVNIEIGRWHKIVSLEPGTVILKQKTKPMSPCHQMIS